MTSLAVFTSFFYLLTDESRVAKLDGKQIILYASTARVAVFICLSTAQEGIKIVKRSNVLVLAFFKNSEVLTTQ